MYKIEKNIPLVKRKNSSKYVSVLSEMEVRDSFLIDTLSEVIHFQTARQIMKPKKFSIRQCE